MTATNVPGITHVLDASAGVEIVLRTPAGRFLASHMAAGGRRWVPELFYVEVAATLRRMVLHEDLPEARAALALERAVKLRLRRARVAEMIVDAWALRHNLTVADACYVVLARSLGGTLVTADRRLARSSAVTVELLTPPGP